MMQTLWWSYIQDKSILENLLDLEQTDLCEYLWKERQNTLEHFQRKVFLKKVDAD